MVTLLVACGTFAAVAGLLRFAPAPVAGLPSTLIPAVVIVAGAAAAFAPAAPTGWDPLDAVLRALLGAAAAAAGATRPTGAAWCSVVAFAALAVADSTVAALGAVAAGAALAVVAAGARAPVVAAASAALAVQVLLRLSWPVATGASLAAGAVAVAPVLLLAVGRLGRRARRVAAWAVVGVVGFCLLGAGAGLAAALAARTDLDRGVDQAREGLAALGRDDRDAAARALAAAAASFQDARSAMTAWWVRPALAVPVVAQHARAVGTVARSGRQLGRAAARAIRRADPAALTSQPGVIDLDALEALAGPLTDASDAVDTASADLSGVDSPWLLPPVADRLDQLRDRVGDTRDDARTAAEAAQAAPGLLGADGPRTYFLAVQTPAEARGGGGFMGNWAELVADRGRLVLGRIGGLRELSEGGPDPDARTIAGLDEYLDRYGALRPQRNWGVVNFSNDFPTVAQVIAQLYPQSGGRPGDGVIAVDPAAFAAVLELTGPVTVPSWPEPLTTDNAAALLLHEQYLAFDADDERVDFLAEAVAAVFQRLVADRLPQPGAVASTLGPAVRARHLQLMSVRDDEQRLFARLGATGMVPGTRGGDSVGFVGQNYAGNKIDWYLHRDGRYDVQWDPASGAVEGTLELALRNDAPASGLPHAVIGWGGDRSADQLPVADGENLMLLTLYAAFELSGLTVDGEEVPVARETEFGRRAYTFYVRVPPGATSMVRASVSGRLPPGATYRLGTLWQPVVNADTLTVRVGVPGGWRLDSSDGLQLSGAGTAQGAWTLDGPRSATLVAERRSPGLLDRLRGDG